MTINLPDIDKHWSIEYHDDIFSLNKLYEQGHWSKRKNLKDKYKKIFIKLLHDSDIEKCEKFYIVILYNTRHDVDNIVGVEKVFVDTMKGVLIPNDGKKNFRGLMIFPDETMAKGSLRIIVARINGQESGMTIDLE